MACLKKILIAKRSLSFTQKLALDIFESDDRSHAFWYENFVELIFDIIGKMHVVDAVASDVAIPAVSYVALVLDDGEAERHLAHVWARDQGIWVFIEDDFAQKKREIGEDYSCQEFFPFDIIRWWFDDWEHEKSPNQNHEKGKKNPLNQNQECYPFRMQGNVQSAIFQSARNACNRSYSACMFVSLKT